MHRLSQAPVLGEQRHLCLCGDTTHQQLLALQCLCSTDESQSPPHHKYLLFIRSTGARESLFHSVQECSSLGPTAWWYSAFLKNAPPKLLEEFSILEGSILKWWCSTFKKKKSHSLSNCLSCKTGSHAETIK